MINYSVVCLAGGISREFRIYCGGTFNDGRGGGGSHEGKGAKMPSGTSSFVRQIASAPGASYPVDDNKVDKGRKCLKRTFCTTLRLRSTDSLNPRSFPRNGTIKKLILKASVEIDSNGIGGIDHWTSVWFSAVNREVVMEHGWRLWCH